MGPGVCIIVYASCTIRLFKTFFRVNANDNINISIQTAASVCVLIVLDVLMAVVQST